ncbi:hypothetical protein LOC51_40165 [Rubrivivax sp. JA1024]|nr:hypothetical protein [Rubrivivax sp. JA1024]
MLIFRKVDHRSLRADHRREAGVAGPVPIWSMLSLPRSRRLSTIRATLEGCDIVCPPDIGSSTFSQRRSRRHPTLHHQRARHRGRTAVQAAHGPGTATGPPSHCARWCSVRREPAAMGCERCAGRGFGA